MVVFRLELVLLLMGLGIRLVPKRMAINLYCPFFIQVLLADFTVALPSPSSPEVILETLYNG